MTCRHCAKEKRKLFPRSLCWSCYYNHDIRARYPSLSPQGQWSDRDEIEPTAAEVEAMVAEQMPTMPPGKKEPPQPYQIRRVKITLRNKYYW